MSGVRGRFCRFEDISVATKEVSASLVQELELAMPLLQIIGRNVFLARNEVSNNRC
jgi:hypothetical protein